MVKILDNLGIVYQDGRSAYKCLKCDTLLGTATEDYKNYVLKHDAPQSKGQPAFLDRKSDKFVLREYYCPKCGVMFEVDMVMKDERQITSVKLK